ncbi:exosporium leader peptide-containing protein [Bacillus wiedmannii]|uniref:exosporium leader peptide-containing protein n=1 Tax=Bacillus wiedmannii TaxID=1890302 RepID=UPI00211D6739|nr:exosporium leader peptide-containing protein [Bacillus wiedmannii]
MDEFLSSAAVNPGSIGPTLPPMQPFQFPKGPTGVAAAFGSLNQTLFQVISEQKTIIPFNSLGPSVNTILDIPKNRIIVMQSGVYEIPINLTPNIGNATTSCTASPYVNNISIPNYSAIFFSLPIPQRIAVTITKTVQFPLSANDVRLNFSGSNVLVVGNTFTINRIF